MTTAPPVGAGAPAAPPPVLGFEVERVDPVAHAAVPTLRFTVGVTRTGSVPVRSASLTCLVRIVTDRRAYHEAERDRLVEVLGTDPHRPAPALLWTQVTVQVPAFDREVAVEVPVACTYDFEVAAAKYLHALRDGEVPLELQFSGTVFYHDPGPDHPGRLRAARLPWEECRFGMPARVWRDLMDRYFPGEAWLRLDRDTFDALYAYRRTRTLPTWTDTVRSLLRAAGEG